MNQNAFFLESETEGNSLNWKKDCSVACQNHELNIPWLVFKRFKAIRVLGSEEEEVLELEDFRTKLKIEVLLGVAKVAWLSG